MIRTIFSKSGLSITGDEIYQIVNGRLRAIQADTTNNQVVVYLEEKDGSGTTNSGTTERLFFDVGSGSEALAAEDIINMINGLSKNSQIGKISDSTQDYSVAEVTGVKIPAFTISSTAVALDEDAGPTLATATVGANYSVTITKDSDSSVTLNSTGVIDAASDVLEVFSPQDMSTAGFAADDVCTVTVVLTNPNQPGSTRTVTAAATLTAS